MSSPKARFTGGQPPLKVRDLTDAEVRRLRDLWPGGGRETAWGHPGDEFAACLADVVLGVRAQRHREAVTREDARAELQRVARQLSEAERMLRTLSPEVDALLGAENDPLGCADSIKAMVERFRQAEAARESSYAGTSIAEHERGLMLDVCVQVAGVLKDYGVEATATAQLDLEQVSVAVRCCAEVGSIGGVGRSLATWRDVLAEVLRQEADNRQRAFEATCGFAVVEVKGNMPS